MTAADGAPLAQYPSEFQARLAGRVNAERLETDLVIHQPQGPPIYERFDETSGRMTPVDNPGPTGNADAARSERRPLVLVVEDQVDSRELYAEYLSYAGFSVATAINGHEAVRLAQLLKPDVVLMDIRLPGMDGLEATADLKRDPALAGTPIVAITADPSEEIAERCRRAGCDAFIAKPVLPDEVARQIRAVLATSGGGGKR